jgi:hypothetical protein
MTQKATQTNTTPQRIIEDLWVGRGVQALVAGVELDLFTHIAERKSKAKEIAHACNASQRGIERLLDALVGYGYLHKEDDDYRLNTISEKFLVRGKESYMGDFVYETKSRGRTGHDLQMW